MSKYFKQQMSIPLTLKVKKNALLCKVNIITEESHGTLNK